MGAVNNNFFSLAGKTAIITGATGYLGRIFSESLLTAGAKTILYGRGEKIKNTASDFVQRYGKNKVSYCDVDLYDDVRFRRCLQETVAAHRRIDILINNAFDFSKDTGFNDPSGTIDKISKFQWMKSLESGVYWHSLATQVIAEKMKELGGGSVINISSMYALVAPDPDLYRGKKIFNPPSYGAAKAALLSFTRYCASFYGAFGIRCNALVVGAFPNVEGSSYNSPGRDEEFLQRLSDRTILKRYGRPDDLKGVIVFLASDASSYITGQAIIVDGGWTLL